jgi:hypothetical protein
MKKYVSLRKAKTRKYGNSNISPCKKIIIFKKPLKKETQFLQDIIN